MRRTYLAIGLMVTAVVLAGLGVRAARRAAARRFQAELAKAREELDSGLIGTAQKRLTRLAAERPADPEVAYLLGGSEASRGRFEAALDAWARVPADAPQAAPAAMDFAQVAIRLGRSPRPSGCCGRRAPARPTGPRPSPVAADRDGPAGPHRRGRPAARVALGRHIAAAVERRRRPARAAPRARRARLRTLPPGVQPQPARRQHRAARRR